MISSDREWLFKLSGCIPSGSATDDLSDPASIVISILSNRVGRTALSGPRGSLKRCAPCTVLDVDSLSYLRMLKHGEPDVVGSQRSLSSLPSLGAYPAAASLFRLVPPGIQDSPNKKESDSALKLASWMQLRIEVILECKK